MGRAGSQRTGSSQARSSQARSSQARSSQEGDALPLCPLGLCTMLPHPSANFGGGGYHDQKAIVRARNPDGVTVPVTHGESRLGVERLPQGLVLRTALPLGARAGSGLARARTRLA
jgi:hypothetical protein